MKEAAEKADEIFSKFFSITCNYLDAKECSLYLVEEMIKTANQSVNWKDVKEIIENK